MKKIIMIVLCAITLCLGGCSDTEGEKKATVSLNELIKCMAEADDTLGEMTLVTDADENPEKLFAYAADFDYDRVEHFAMYYSSDGKLADEMIVIALKDKADAGAAKEGLKAHVESRKKLYEQYQPDQVELVESNMIFSKEQYVVLIISDKKEEVKKTFEAYIGQTQE